MPANRFNGFTDYGVGIGLRIPHYRHIFAEKPVVEDGGIKLFTDEKNAAELAKAAGTDKSLAGYLKAHLGRIGGGDYFALLAFIQMNSAHEKALQTIRHVVRDKKRVATCLGFGPKRRSR